MILVDTSVWIDHFREPIESLTSLLAATFVLQHPYVTGELALGSFKARHHTLEFLNDLPRPRVASQAEFLAFVDKEGLAGTGVGFIDAHLLAACRLNPGTFLWSRDKRLDRCADEAGMAWRPA